MEQQQHEADIEAKRAAAIAALAQVGLDHRDMRLQEANAALDGLLSVHSAMQPPPMPAGGTGAPAVASGSAPGGPPV
jgi:hypothetical protein